jgi:hypothetical protein
MTFVPDITVARLEVCLCTCTSAVQHMKRTAKSSSDRNCSIYHRCDLSISWSLLTVTLLLYRTFSMGCGADAHTHAHPHTHALTHAHTHAYTHARTHACMQTNKHTYKTASTHPHTNTHTRAHTQTNKQTHEQTHKQTHKQTTTKQSNNQKTDRGMSTLRCAWSPKTLCIRRHWPKGQRQRARTQEGDQEAHKKTLAQPQQRQYARGLRSAVPPRRQTGKDITTRGEMQQSPHYGRIAQRSTTPGGTRPITAMTLRMQEHGESQCQPRKQIGYSQQQHDANHNKKTIREYCAASCHPRGRQETVKNKGRPSTATILHKSIAQRGATPGDKQKSYKISTIPITKTCERIAGSSASSGNIQKTVKTKTVMAL